jgi:hypothetical protein
MLEAFVEVFVGFWGKDRLLLKRIHGIAAIDPEFGKAVEARNQRRKMGATRVVELLCRGAPGVDGDEKSRRISMLVALTSFEFFDSLAESSGSTESAAAGVGSIVKKVMGLPRAPEAKTQGARVGGPL